MNLTFWRRYSHWRGRVLIAWPPLRRMTFEEFCQLVICEWVDNARFGQPGSKVKSGGIICPCGHDVGRHGIIDAGCDASGCECGFYWVDAGLASLGLPADFKFTAEKAMPHA